MPNCARHQASDGANPNAPRSPDCGMCRVEEVMARVMPRDPRTTYWVGKNGWHYGWTTERMGDEKYAAFARKPIGKGAKTGKATRFKLVKEIHFAKRSTAKARAWKWMQTANAAKLRENPEE